MGEEVIVLWSSVGILVLLALSSFFASAGASLTALTGFRLRRYLANEPAKRELFSPWLTKSDRLLLTIWASNRLINIALTLLCVLIVELWLKNQALGVILLVSFGFSAVLILLFGELVPKSLAKRNAEAVAGFSIAPINVLSRMLVPLASLVLWVTNRMLAFVGKQSIDFGSVLTEEEIDAILEEGAHEGAIEIQEREMIRSIFDFGKTVVREVMVPRVDMIGVEQTDSIASTISVMMKEGHSRIPVYNGDIDHIVGIVYGRDLLEFLQGEKGLPVSVGDVMRDPTFVPETKPIDKLLREFQRTKVHMAIVVDEYGGTAGLVTIEDILEEIVGEIQDEYDEEVEQHIQHLSKEVALVDARTSIDEVKELLRVSIPDGEEYDTVGGFMASELGKVPDVGDVVETETLKLIVEEADERRVEKIRLELKNDIQERDSTHVSEET